MSCPVSTPFAVTGAWAVWMGVLYLFEPSFGA